MLRQNEIFYNKLKWILKERKKTVGAWLQAASPITAEIFGKAGFDFVMVDMEHGPGDVLTLISQLQAVSKFDVTPLARAPWNDPVAIKKILDAGLYGVLVPYVSTREEAEAAVKACKYPLEGIRGVAPSPRAGGYGMNGNNYLENANEQIIVMTAMETPEAVANIDEIVKVNGLDGIFIGPMDLATSMGHFGNPKHPEVQEAIAKIEKAVLASDKFLGTVAGNFEVAQSLYEKGYSYVVVMSDTTSLAKLALDNVSKFRETYPQR
jgi:2-keto-3-deoxy-L-rhamnonate aldolase RhmA